MRIGIFADSHDHVEQLQRVVARCNEAKCDLVLFAGDLVSTFVVPILRNLEAPVIGCFGDNEGNKVGLVGGWSIVGTIGEPPLGVRLPDGTRVLLTHQKELLLTRPEGSVGDDLVRGADVVVYAHTHRPFVGRDAEGRLWINPGEASGWTFGRSTMALWETDGHRVQIVELERTSRACTHPR